MSQFPMYGLSTNDDLPPLALTNPNIVAMLRRTERFTQRFKAALASGDDVALQSLLNFGGDREQSTPPASKPTTAETILGNGDRIRRLVASAQRDFGIWNNKEFHELKPMERLALKKSDNALYDTMRADWLRRGEP